MRQGSPAGGLIDLTTQTLMHSFFIIQMYQTVLNSLRSERWLQQMCKAELRPKQVGYSSRFLSLTKIIN